MGDMVKGQRASAATICVIVSEIRVGIDMQ